MPTFIDGENGQSIRNKLNEILEHATDTGSSIDWNIQLTVNGQPIGGSSSWSEITGKPTTLLGYGITDAATSAQGAKADTAHGWGNHADAGYLTSAEPAYTESEVDEFLRRGWREGQSESASNLAVGWYTIAVISSGRGIAKFAIRDTASSRHQSVLFTVGHTFGKGDGITMLHQSLFGTRVFRYIRIKELGTYDGCAVQVYIENATNNIACYHMGDEFQSESFVLKNWIPDATDPGTSGSWALYTESVLIDLSACVGGFATTGEVKTNNRFYSNGTSGTTTGANDGGLQVQNNGGTGDTDLAKIELHCSNTYATGLYLRHDSYIGIGGWSASAWRWYLQCSTGNMTAAGNVTAYSDPRLKQNVTKIEGALDKLNQIEGVSFQWRDMPGVVGNPLSWDYGVLADQMERVFPETVHSSAHESPDGDAYKTVAYDKLVPVLIEAVKELSDRVKELENGASK